MGRNGAPGRNEQKSVLAKQILTKKRESRKAGNGSSGAVSYGPMAEKKGITLNRPTQHAVSEAPKSSLFSVMEMASVDEFLVHAKMTNREFEARRGWFDESLNAPQVLGLGQAGVSSGPRIAGSYDDGESSRPYEWHALPMPERPPWKVGDTSETLDAREAQAFVDWRRRLALTEEAVWAAQDAAPAGGVTAKVTPYEKNMDVWRQLWRVVERSDVLVQVIDARQPLFYYSQQLHNYARTHYRGPGQEAAHVERLMIVNKADYLTRSQRRAWAAEFKARGFRFVWFSALLEQNKLNEAEKASRTGGEALDAEAAASLEAEMKAWESYFPRLGNGEDDESLEVPEALTDEEEEELERSAEEDDDEDEGEGRDKDQGNDAGGDSEAATVEGTAETAVAAEQAPQEAAASPETKSGVRSSGLELGRGEGAASEVGGSEGEDDTRLLGRDELLRYLETLSKEATKGSTSGRRAQVGFVGYPNVGKSSVINVLLGATPLNHSSLRVATGATPGKTKHFQTLNLPPVSAGPDATPLTICDCPGLVFPQFVSSAADMMLAGVLRHTQLKDFVPPMRLLMVRIPKAVLELTYGFRAPKVGAEGLDGAGGELEAIARASAAARAASAPTDAAQLSEFLTVEATLVGIGKARSWFAAGNKGEVDRARVARMLMADAQTGKLVFALPPPSLPFGSPAYADFVAATHRARFSELRKRKSLPDPKQAAASGGGPGGGGGGGIAGGAGTARSERRAAAALASDPEAWMEQELALELEGDDAGKDKTRAGQGRVCKNSLLEAKQRHKAKKGGRKARAAAAAGVTFHSPSSWCLSWSL